jgi:hypothetical protein
MKMREVVASWLGLSLAMGCLSSFAAPMPGPARVGTARLEPHARALLIPFEGHAPAVTLRKVAPMQYIADFGDARLAREEVQSQGVGGKRVLAGWSMDETPSGHVVRLRLTLRYDVDPRLHVERVGHTLRLAFGAEAPRFELAHRSLPEQLTFAAPKAPVALALPTGVAMLPTHPAPAHHGPAALGTPHFDAHRNCLVVPVAGVVDPAKLKFVHLGKRWAYLDLPASRPTFNGVRYQDQLRQPMQRWVMAKRPRQNTTRLSFNLQAGSQLDVKLAGKELLVAVRPVAPAVARALPTQPAPVAAKASAPKPVAAKPAAKPTVLAQVPVKPIANRPYFDQARRALVLPYTGETPLYRFNNQAASTATIEFKGVLAPAGKLEQRFGHHPVMEAWQVQRNDRAGTVQVTLNFRRPAELVVAADPARKQLLLMPQPRVAGDETPVAARSLATLSAARLPAEGREIYIPYAGHVPAYSIEQVSPTQAYVHFLGAKLDGDGVQVAQPSTHPTISQWLLSERPGQHLVRLALTLHQPGGVQVFQDRTNQRLVVQLDGTEPKVGMRTRSQRPAEWPDEQHMVGKKAS